ncbi:apolipophorins isoform X2 [Frieseomelitta varia]|uniref:apolipophorins isoform X2 n=1 Tax=Frieseomelitta varia TaxID=561572 RepID=UPI001CB6A3EF|nr:apolipophorins isoform X2 [Frieseomelitta varia]
MHPNKAYQEGQTYIYNLEGTSVTSVTDAQGDATLKLSATVELSVKPDCIHQLRLKNVRINGAPPSTPDVERFAVQFNYHDGHIDTQLCTEPGDSQASLNIKRAVVSLFQSTVVQDSGSTTRHETDVMGSCPTQFNFRKEGDSVIVNKNRNLAGCAFRENVNHALISGNTDTTAGVKTVPLLASQQSIEQRFKRGVLNKAVSKEVYNLLPFSNGNAGAKTIVETSLTLKDQKGDSPAAEVSQPKSLIFEAPHPVLQSSPEAINNALKAAKAEVAGGVKPAAAAKFTELVKVLRLSSKNDILSVYQKIRPDKSEQKLFLDGLFRARSGEAAEVGVDLIKNKELSSVQTLLFYAGLTTIRHVNLPSVAVVATLLDQPNLPRLGYLGVGQVIGKYCQQHSCENVPEVKQAVHKIREKVGNGKTKTREQENTVISALKALGNTRFLDDATLQKLANIGADKNVRNRVRVAAIEALPNRCTMKWKNILLKVLADREEDSEVRIKTYLSLVACPCPQVANQLKEVLDKETVNQVGSFVQSHLRNLRASTDPSKLDAKAHLGQIKPRGKFPEDIRKFSFNNELSYKVDSLGVGSTLESNVIYSQNSFVPRSTNLNMTVELFGRNFNFLEVNTRVENLDRLLEQYFGPKGKIWEKDLEDLKTGANAASKLGKYAKERYERLVRSRREVKQADLDKFARNVQLNHNEVDQDLDVDLSVKLFGVELAYLSYQGDRNKLNPEAIIDKAFSNLEKGFNVVKNLNYDLENYLQFLDSDLVYPTGLGSALSLGLTGTSALRLKTYGKLDLQAILKDPRNANFRVAMEPSVSVRIAGNLVVQAPGAESGMRIVTTLHTATSSDISVAVLNGHGIDVNFGIPKKKQEIVNVESEVLLSSGAKGNEYVAPKFVKGKEYSDCFEQLSTVLGITVCGKVSYPHRDSSIGNPRPLFPLNGPARFAVSLENNDVTSYRFKVDLNVRDEKKRSFEILLDTPNSKTNRRVALNVEAGLEPNVYVRAAFHSPIKTAAAEAVLKNTAKERTLTVTINHDQLEFRGRVGLLSSGSKYTPVFEYKLPEHIQQLASARTGLGPSQQYNVEGSVDVTNYEGGQKYVLDKVALVAGDQKLLVVDGTIAWTPSSVKADTTVGYTDKNLAFKLDGKWSKDDFKLSVSGMPSSDPNIGFNLNWELKRGENNIDHKFVFIHGADPNSETNRLSLIQSAVYNLDPKNLVLSASSKLTYPVVNLKLKGEGKLTRKSVSASLEAKYKTFKYGTELSAKKDTEKPGDYEIELEAELMENSVELKAKRVVLEARKSQFTNSLRLEPGGKYTADAVVTHVVERNNLNLQLDGQLDLNGKKAKLGAGLEANPQLLNAAVNAKIDGVTYVDFNLKTTRVPNPSGTLNVDLRNWLIATGQFSYKDRKGSANLDVNIPKINRKIKATGSLVGSGTQEVLNLELLYDAEKDPSKRVKVSSVSDITATSLDTKNVIDVLNYKLEANVKGQLQGSLREGQLQVDADVTLPSGRHLVYKGRRDAAKRENKYDVKVSSELNEYEQKGGPSRKLAANFNMLEFDPIVATFKANGDVKYVNREGKDARLAWNAKNLDQPDKKRLTELRVEVDGTRVPRKLQLQADSVKGDGARTYNVKSSLGDDLSLSSNVDLREGNNVDKPWRADGVLEVKLPSEKLSNLKLEVSSSLLHSNEPDITKATDTVRLTYNNDKKIELDSELELKGLSNTITNPSEGQGKLAVNILDLPRVQLSGNYKFNPTSEKKTATSVLDVQYGEKAISFRSDSEYLPASSTINIKAKGNLLHEKLRNVDLQLLYTRSEEENKVSIDSKVVADGNKYTLNSEIQHLDTNSLFHVIATCPNGKREVLSKFQKLNDKEYQGEWRVDTPKGFVKADAHLNLESIDNFVINANFDSDKVKHRKIHAEIANKPTAKSGKTITVTVTSDGKNVVTGSTNYKRRDEDGKIVVEGNGNLKIGENTRSSSFKYTRQQLSREKDGEVGVAMVLNANFGPSAIVGELKLSNKELHIFNSYCEQNKDCALFKLQSIVNVQQKALLKHQVTVEVDLKKFNVPVEFGLKTSTELKNPIFDHTTNLYLHSSKDKTEYTYQLYIHPKEAASILTLPSREVATILTYDLPKSKQTAAYKIDASLYMDRKNKPSDKTSLSVIGDINVEKNSVSLSGETKFTYPTQPKDMVVKGNLQYGGEQLFNANLDVDVFAKRAQKITIAANLQRQEIPDGRNVTGLIEVNSRGQQLKLDLKSHLTVSSKQIGFGSLFTYNDVKQKPKTLGALFSADASHVSLLVTLPDRELIRDEWKLDISKNKQKIDRELSLLGDAPRVLSLEASDFNKFKLEVYLKDIPKDKVIVNGQMVFGQLAQIHADYLKDGTKKNLFHALVHLDEKQFLKPDFGYSKENIVELLQVVKNKNLALVNRLKEINEYALEQVKAEGTDLVEHLKKAQPNMKPLVDYYQGELNKIKNELSADETIKEIQATLNKYFGAIISAITETMKQVAKGVEKLQQQLNELTATLKEAVRSIYPKLKESYDKIFRHVVDIVDTAVKLANTYLNAVLDLINQHQKEIKDVINVVTGLSQDFAKVVLVAFEQIKRNVSEFYTMLVNELKALPVYEMLKEKLEELKNFEVPETVLGPLEEVCKITKTVLPTEELRELVDAGCQYVVKHLKQEKLDEVSELKRLYSHLIAAIQSLLGLVQKQTTLDNLLSYVQFQPLDFSLWYRLPGIPTVRFSVLNLLRNGELPTPLDLYHAYRPTLYVQDIVPPFSKWGIVTDGGHFFTFDGRHLSLSGTCTYILAQDMQDGNFSVVANFNNGNLISITITEPKESITLKNNGNILVNNKPADYPANTNNLHAFLIQPFGNVKSDYGVWLTCTNKAPMICTVQVSGFYLGKLRGIFGDANNEPYDDFTLPSGKITESGAEFGNAYKLKGECSEATAVDHTARAPVCTDYFTGTATSLKSCFDIVNPAQYRDACDHAVAGNTPAGACIIASAYHTACYKQGVMSTRIPASCTNCKVGANKVDVGDTFSVKIPKKEADVIFVVEQQTPNEKIYKELVVPLMSELRTELKQHGVTDVHIGLIGYSEKMKWPLHYTLNGETNIEGEVKNMKFDEKKPTITLQEAKNGDTKTKLDYLHQKLDVELGTFKLTDAYEAAIRYPFRPGAAKAVIGVIANPCEKTPFLISLQQIRLLLGHKIYRDLGLTYYHVSYPEELLVSGKAQKNIVGYDQDSVYTFADSKKKPLTGSTDMKSNLSPAIKDVCADFAVSSGGAAFSSNNFLDAKPNQKKQFVHVAAKRVADGLVNLELEKDCSCEYQYGMIGRAQCKIVARKEVQRPKGGAKD